MLKAVSGRVLIKVDVEQKNHHTFSNGTTIKLERNYDNFDKKQTNQVLGEVLDAEHIPTGAMVLFHHNAIHEVNEVFNHSKLSGEEIASGFKILSIAESEVFLWKLIGVDEWLPAKNFCIAERVWEPYKGVIAGIPPTKIKNVLFIKTGELEGRVVRTLHACDFPIMFVNEKGKEQTIIRCRHFEDEDNEREEIVAIDHTLTERLYNQELLIGIDALSAKPFGIPVYES
jgi:hypothetical protein